MASWCVRPLGASAHAAVRPYASPAGRPGLIFDCRPALCLVLVACRMSCSGGTA